MRNPYLDREGLIAARATAPGRAALALVRASGKGCDAALAPYFSRPKALVASPGMTILHGYLLEPFMDEKALGRRGVDEVLVSVFRAPRSYTGEDALEISCHGGEASTARVLALLRRAGFRDAAPGEFTLRAYLNGKLDLAQAEAVDELSRARTVEAQAAALARLRGSVSGEAAALRSALVDDLAAIELCLDYGEDEAEGPALDAAALKRRLPGLEALLASWRGAAVLRDGLRAVILGRTNAGKSTLFNRLLMEDRALVSEEHGTTRDYLEAWLDLAGVPVLLTDTAGLREAGGVVESAGMARSRQLAAAADILIYVVDAREGLSPMDEEELALFPGAILVWNKVDAPGGKPVPDAALPLSALSGQGMEGLEGALRAACGSVAASDAGAALGTVRQRELVERALDSLRGAIASMEAERALDLVAVDLKDAVEALGEISGEGGPDEVLERIFSRFCVGK